MSTSPGNFKERMLAQIPPGTSRREFLQLMGAVIVMGTLEGCREHEPIEEVVSYARTPESALQGPYTHYATAMVVADSVLGVRVTSHQGRPIKVEGNPLHPFSRGTTNVFAQASLYDLYDPHRASMITQGGEDPRDWPQFRRALASVAGSRLRIVMGAVHSPTDERLLREVLARHPGARVTFVSSASSANVVEGARRAFGRALTCVRDFGRAETVVLFDDDRFGVSAEGLREARDWVERRNLDRPDFVATAGDARMFVAEPSWTYAGGLAEVRLPVRRSRVAMLVRELARRAGLVAADGNTSFTEDERAWLDAVAARKNVLFGAGPAQPPEVHEWICRLNEHAKAPVRYFEAANLPEHDLQDLLNEMRTGLVGTVLVLGGNPVYESPTDFANALKRVKFSAYLGSYVNETSRACVWHIPLAHDLEQWGDLRNTDGTTSLVQPLINPLYNGRTIKEVLSILIDGENSKDAYTLTRDTWKRGRDEFTFEAWWKKQLFSGVVETKASEVKPKLTKPAPLKGAEVLAAGTLEAIFIADASAWDGRTLNNAWLQELPRPFSELTWDNAGALHSKTAEKLKLKTGDLAEIRAGDKKIEIPVFTQDGVPEDQIILPLGYGQLTSGIGAGVGVDVGLLRTLEQFWSRTDVTLAPTGRRYALAFAQKYSRIEDEKAAQVVTKQTLKQRRDEKPAGLTKDPSTPVTTDKREERWGMVIDLDACIACKVCTIACQVENNIPVVGKKQVLMGREMHWIRVDRYTRNENAKTKFDPQPVPCMHCEKAPCEIVCPVNASVHSSDGLNQQVYNRCIGTRFCANNCPYKVRRFNFLKYTGWDDEAALRQAYNPDVTVRSRGVMEKCSYCIQRINRARLEAEIQERAIEAPVTACQQACPTKAIVFGDLNDEKSLVRKLKMLPREYTLLQELGTQPRTTYLAKVDR